MTKKLIALFLAAAALFALTACAEKEPAPPPDLTGEWTQNSDGEWYHIATITDDTITVYWYLPAEDLREFYWYGTFTPPTTGDEPYSWESTSNFSIEELNSSYAYVRTSREEVKTFTYKDGRLSYIVTAGHLKMTFALEKVDEE